MDMGKGGGNMPPLMDPLDLTKQQTGLNRESAQFQTGLNRVNQYTPYGYSEWQNKDGKWSQHLGLDPMQQRFLDTNNLYTDLSGNMARTALQRANQMYQSPLSMDRAPAPVYGVQTDGKYTTNVPTTQAGFGATPSVPGLQGGVQTAQNFINRVDGKPIQMGVDLSGAPAMPEMNEDTRRRVEEALYSRINPQLDRSQASLNTELANQGIMPGSEAYLREQQRIAQERNDARYGAVRAGGEEMAREFGLGLQARQQGVGEQFNLGNFANAAQGQDFSQQFANAGMQNQNQQNIFGQNLAAGNFANAAKTGQFGMGMSSAALQNALQAQQFGQGMQNAQLNNQVQQQRFNQGLANANLQNQGRQNYLQENAFLRNMPLNEAQALRSGSQVQNPQFPNFAQTNVMPADLGGNVNNYYQNMLKQYGLNVGQENNFMEGLFGLGAATAKQWGPWLGSLFSDRRLKSNIRRIGTHPLGIGIYEYDIFGHRDVGVMADEVLEVKPSAVLRHPSGYLMVNYGGLC